MLDGWVSRKDLLVAHAQSSRGDGIYQRDYSYSLAISTRAVETQLRKHRNSVSGLYEGHCRGIVMGFEPKRRCESSGSARVQHYLSAYALGYIVINPCLLAAFLFADGTLVQKLALRETSPLTATWLGCVAGAVSLVPFLGQTIAEVSVASPSTLVAALYLGIGPTALAF